MNIFCDIDGTLTDNGEIANGKPLLNRIKKLKKLSDNNNVIIWSGNGLDYAQHFRNIHGLYNCIAIGKPDVMIDDNQTIRPNWNSKIKLPSYLD